MKNAVKNAGRAFEDVKVVSEVWCGKSFVVAESSDHTYEEKILMGWRNDHPTDLCVAVVRWNGIEGCLVWGEYGTTVRVDSISDDGMWVEESYPVYWLKSVADIASTGVIRSLMTLPL